MTSMLPGAPWLLAHKSMLQPDKPRKISLQGNDYVLWLDGAGEVQALPNACPHMGAMLSEGWCKAGEVICPFHALAFDGQGCTVLPGSGKKTLPQLQPLPLIIDDDFIWSYGQHEPLTPIHRVMEAIAADYELLGVAGEYSVETPLLPMLLNMHDYNHQNGTHRPLFEITEIQFQKFIDQGHYSAAYYNMPRAQPPVQDILNNPALLAMPKVIEALLENFFPSMVIFHGTTPFGQIRQCHFFVPESLTHTRTYVLVYGKAEGMVSKAIAQLLKPSILKLVDTVVQQDADILAKIYPDHSQKIKLNNEIGMDWVTRNYHSFPEITVPTLGFPSRSGTSGA
jgi:phenylpropionate dioxygenase-like ring-hydroxylating dioxygenase large terminal subunit